jgi:hypothetical protein
MFLSKHKGAGGGKGYWRECEVVRGVAYTGVYAAVGLVGIGDSGAELARVIGIDFLKIARFEEGFASYL